MYIGPTLPQNINGAYSGHSIASHTIPSQLIITGGMGTVTPKQSLIINPNSDLDHFGMTIGYDLNHLRTMHGSASFQIGDDSVVVIAGGSSEDASNTCEILYEDGWTEGMKYFIICNSCNVVA